MSRKDKVYFDIFTDGSSNIEGKGTDNPIYTAGSGYMIVMNKNPIMRKAYFHDGETNQYAEVYSINNSLQYMVEIMEKLDIFNRKITPVLRVYTDSAFAMNGYEKWMFGWDEKYGSGEWYSSGAGKKPVCHQDLFREILESVVKPYKGLIKIEYYKIKGHIVSESGKVSPQKLKTYYIKFQKQNNVKLSKDDFLYIVNGNEIADRLSKRARIECIDIEKKGGKIEYVFPLKDF